MGPSGCTYIETECVEYDIIYVPEQEDDDSENLPGGSDGGDPCEPCTQDPGGPVMACDSQPGGGDGIPQGCSVDTDFEILDPCDQADQLGNNIAFIDKMNTLETNAYNENFETGYLLSGTFGNYSYTFQSGDPGDPFMNFTGITNPIDGYIHSHFSGTISTFSGQDVRAIYILHQAGKINNLNSFTAGVVTALGTSYLMKISNRQAFLDFGEENFNSETSFESFEEFYNNWFDTYENLFQKTETEARELALLKALEGSGITLFKGNSNFNNWNAIGNENNSTVNTNCN